jgi:arabinofuranosyltransferase
MRRHRRVAEANAAPAPATAAAPILPVLLATAVLSVVYALFLAHGFGFNNVDDAYISYRYGWHLMRGFGLVFNPNETVEGYTSFLWTVVMAPWTKTPFDIAWVAIALGLLASIATLWGLALHARALGRDGGGAWMLAAVPLVGLDGSHDFWSVSGMETAPFTALLVWASYWMLHRDDQRSGWFAGFLFGLTALTRPEGFLFFGLLVAHQFLAGGVRRARVLRSLPAFAAVTVPHLVWRIAFYGDWLPNTFRNKVSVESRGIASGLRYAASGITWRFGAPLVALLALLRPALAQRLSAYFVMTLGYLGYMIVVGGDCPVANRFFVPVLPFLALLTVAAIVEWIPAQRARAVALAAVIAASSLGVFLKAEPTRMVWENQNAVVETQRRKFGKWLRTQMPPGTLIATGPSGAIPYYSELRCIDMWGLTDRHIATMPRKEFWPGHDRSDLAYVLAQRPALIVGTVGFGDYVPAGYSPVNDLIPAESRPTEAVFAGGGR